MGKQLNCKQSFLDSQGVCNFHGRTHGDIKNIGFTESFIEKKKRWKWKKESQNLYFNLGYNVTSCTYLYGVLNDIWEPLRPRLWQASALFKYFWKMEPVAGLDVLHLAGDVATEDGHAPLYWKLTFLSPLLS